MFTYFNIFAQDSSRVRTMRTVHGNKFTFEQFKFEILAILVQIHISLANTLGARPWICLQKQKGEFGPRMKQILASQTSCNTTLYASIFNKICRLFETLLCQVVSLTSLSTRYCMYNKTTVNLQVDLWEKYDTVISICNIEDINMQFPTS